MLHADHPGIVLTLAEGIYKTMGSIVTIFEAAGLKVLEK